MLSRIKVALLWNKKQADLNPPLGYPGGPCYVIERILSKKLGPKQEKLIRIVEEGMDLDYPERLSHLVYDKLMEDEAPGTQFEWFGLSSHAQYRMDLRGITLKDILLGLVDFQKNFAKEKSKKSSKWADTQKAIDNSEEILWVSKRLGNLAIGFTVMTKDKVSPGAYIQTVYFIGDKKPPPVSRHDCKPWSKWVEQTPIPTRLEKIFEGKTGSLYLKRASDLYPPLGYPGGPCQVMERIRDGVPNPRLQEDLVDSVEQGLDLSNPQAAKIYDQIIAPGVPGTPTSKIVFTNHAQYRMDLRGITIPQVRACLKNFWKAFARQKSMKTPLYKEWEVSMAWGEGIRWEDPKSEFSLVFEVRKDTAFIVTLFWTKFTKPPVMDESRCKYDQPLPAEGYFEGSGTKTKLGLKSGPEPVTTFVTDKSEQNLPTDQDREKQVVLPLPGSATPGSGGRDIPRVEYNTPDSGSNISERPRTLGVPGEQYGNPYKEDYNMPTRRTMTSRVMSKFMSRGPK